MDLKASKKWKFFVPTAALIATLLFLGLTYHKFAFRRTWTSQELAAGTNLEPDLAFGHGPVVRPSDQDDVSTLLHPEAHVDREPRTFQLHWNITKGHRRPDGVAKEVYLINDQFPGPTLEFRSGDEVILNVHNALHNESTSIHWHGLMIRNGMDGVVGVTQCASMPGHDYIYKLAIPDDQAGTFWYHAHSETQRADGLFGPLIVHRLTEESKSKNREYVHDDDQVLLVGDWYHNQAEEVLDSYTDWKMFKIEPAPDSLLLNGKGYFECSRATRARPVDCEKNGLRHLTLSERTRLRVVNVGALTGVSISMVGYTIELVEIDGGRLVEPMLADSVGVLYPGERMDLVLTRQDLNDEQSAWITVSLDRENMQFPNLALIDTQQFPVVLDPSVGATHDKRQVSTTRSGRINLSAAQGAENAGSGILPHGHTEPDETILLYTTIGYLTQYEYRPKGFVNHSSWTPSSSDLPLLARERTEWPRDPAPLVKIVQQGHWVELVINNMDDKGHPFHLHGHDFHVLRSHQPDRRGAFEQFNPFEDHNRSQLNFQNSLAKDTVYVPSMGYVVLGFRATNPGLWLLHCHVLWHEAVGMNLAIQVGPDANASQREAASSACGS